MEATITSGTTYQELKRADLRTWLGMVGFVVQNSFRNWLFFLPSFSLDLIDMFTAAGIFFLMGQFVAKGARGSLGASGTDYGTYIVVGVMLNLALQATLRVYHQTCLECYGGNQFNTYMLYPGGVGALLTGQAIARYVYVGLQTLAYFLVGIWLFRVPLVLVNLPDVLAILALAVLALTGLGLAGASTFSLLDAKGWGANPVEWLVGFAVTLLSGVYFPPTVLPTPLQAIGAWLPQTHALHAARLCLAGQATLLDPAIAGDLRFLLGFTVVTLPLGAVVFGLGMRKAHRDGSLTRWS